MIKGQKRTFYPKVGSTCSFCTGQHPKEITGTVVGYIKYKSGSDRFAILRGFSESHAGSNGVVSTFVRNRVVYAEDMTTVIELNSDSIRTSGFTHRLVPAQDLKYIHSGKQIKVTFKLPKI